MSEAIFPEKTLPYADPRHWGLGTRVLATANVPFHMDGGEYVETREYEKQRLTIGVPDGWRDATSRNFVLELGYDALHGVHFNKGCYIGQEVTARMHHRNVLRKCFYKVESLQGRTLPAAGTPITLAGVEVGEMRSSNGNLGLAMMRIAKTEAGIATEPAFHTAGDEIRVTLPDYMNAKIDLIRDQLEEMEKAQTEENASFSVASQD